MTKKLNISYEKKKSLAKRKANNNNRVLKYFITHPNKIFYRDEKITKQDLAHYYYSISSWILPYIKNRFLTLVRCPEGLQKSCFYQRHLNEEQRTHPLYSLPGRLGEKEKFIFIKDKKGLLSLIQRGTLEIHTWGCRVDKLEKPDLMTFDLDPGPAIVWGQVIEAAFLIKDELEKLNLISFVKTTGGKGLHIVIPIKRLYNWNEIKIFSHTFVRYLELVQPSLYTTQLRKAYRRKRIFIDYLRNQYSATCIAPYSTRLKKNASVATPLAWNELSSTLRSDGFTLWSLPERLKRLSKDPWKDIFNLKQILRFPKISN